METSWQIRQPEFHPGEIGKYETLFALGNGRLGIRGTLDDGRSMYQAGTFINGFYETEPIVYGERVFGDAKNHQRMVNVTDGTAIEILIDDDPFDLSTGVMQSFERVLDLASGVLYAEYRWVSPSGVAVEIRTRRIIPFTRRATAAIQYRIRLPEKPAVITVISGIRSRQNPAEASDDPRVGVSMAKSPFTSARGEVNRDYALLSQRTRNTGFRLVTAICHDLRTTSKPVVSAERSADELSHRFVVGVDANNPITLEKFLSYEHTTDDRRVHLATAAKRSVFAAREAGFDGLAAEQVEYLSRFWAVADIRISGADSVQETIRFNLFHVLQSAGSDGRTNFPAKGLTGEGYEGHYFWDTEIYAMPIFTYLVPETARSLIEYRYRKLPYARARAQELSHAGALFPWRTINGEEASAYFPAGTAQYHINADIVYAARRYAAFSGDSTAERELIAPIAIETARFWVSLGNYSDDGRFCINDVTGPDEYTAIVNNNVYTNLMARDNLRYAVALVRRLPGESPAAWDRLVQELAIGSAEVSEWEEAAERMYIPFDETKRLYPQDDSFFGKKIWDFENTPRDKYPLLLHFHPLTIYRHQVLKQPDLVMALFLQGESFTEAEKRDNFRYYDRLTTGDSSLAACVQSIMAAETGDLALAYRYFTRTVRMDLDDINGNARDGIHAAAMAGTWLSIVYGFAGLRDSGPVLRFSPVLPESWTGLSFNLRIRGQVLAVSIDRAGVRYTLSGGPADRTLTILHCGTEITLAVDRPVELPGRKLSGR